jgi:alanine transaminase
MRARRSKAIVRARGAAWHWRARGIKQHQPEQHFASLRQLSQTWTLTLLRTLLAGKMVNNRLNNVAAHVVSSVEIDAPKVLEADTINKNIMDMEYAVRGKLVIKAGEYQKQLDEKTGTLPFDEIILCNIGNPQSLGQKPLTFYRQVLAGCMAPELLDSAVFPSDVVERCNKILDNSSGLGAYSESKGVPVIRDSVAAFLQDRDGHTADPDHIFLTSGASDGIKTIMSMCIRDENDGILAPIPQYPLYSASTTALGGTLLGYPLDETTGWKLTVPSLKKVVADARANGITPRALCVINPGNPTGQLLTASDISEVLEFCEEEGLLMMADEVYQENVYADGEVFTSFKKVLCDKGITSVELASFHSVSKGLQGECGLRGGYMELVNFSEIAIETVYKAVSVGLCSNLPVTNAFPRPRLDRAPSNPWLCSLRHRAHSAVSISRGKSASS